MPDEVFVLLLIPIASLSAGLTLHYAVKPFFEGLIRAMRDPKRLGGGSGPEVAELRAELHYLSETVEALREKVEFDRQLTAPVDEEAS